MPGKLKRSGFLSGCFHFHKSNSTAGHQYDAVWNACRSGRREFPAHTTILLYCLCEFFFNYFFSHGSTYTLSPFDTDFAISSMILDVWLKKPNPIFLPSVTSMMRSGSLLSCIMTSNFSRLIKVLFFLIHITHNLSLLILGLVTVYDSRLQTLYIEKKLYFFLACVKSVYDCRRLSLSLYCVFFSFFGDSQSRISFFN